MQTFVHYFHIKLLLYFIYLNLIILYGDTMHLTLTPYKIKGCRGCDHMVV